MGPNFSNLYAMGNLWKEEVMLLVCERNIHRYSIALAHSLIHNSCGNDMKHSVSCVPYIVHMMCYVHSVKTVHLYSIALTSMSVCNSYGYHMGHSMFNVP